MENTQAQKREREHTRTTDTSLCPIFPTNIPTLKHSVSTAIHFASFLREPENYNLSPTVTYVTFCHFPYLCTIVKQEANKTEGIQPNTQPRFATATTTARTTKLICSFGVVVVPPYFFVNVIFRLFITRCTTSGNRRPDCTQHSFPLRPLFAFFRIHTD